MTNTSEQIHIRMAAAFANIRGVSKDGWNTGQKFHFRSIDDVAAAVKTTLENEKIYVVPNYEILQMIDTGGKGIHIFVRGEFKFYADDGSFVTATAIGEGRDSYDKATNKAMSAAFKYALLQTFCIGDPDDEGDAHSPSSDTSRQAQTSTQKTPSKAPAANQVGPKEWGEWLAVRERVSANEQFKSKLAENLQKESLKVAREMSLTDFKKLMNMAETMMSSDDFVVPVDD